MDADIWDILYLLNKLQKPIALHLMYGNFTKFAVKYLQ